MRQLKLFNSVLIFLLFMGLTGVLVCAPQTGKAYGLARPELLQAIPDWQQVNSNGFGDPLAGEVSALETFNGSLYAGIHSDLHDARIYRSPDGVSWTPVIQPGFGISHDTAPRAILDFVVFNNQLYTSTGRSGNPGQIYRTLNGINWTPMVIYGFNDQDNVDITALAVYDGKIYAGVTNSVIGAQIWSSYTGDNNSWTKVAFQTPEIPASSVTGFAEYNGVLYAAVESESPVQIWQSNGGPWTVIVNDGFGDSNTTLAGGMAIFGTYLYVGAGNTTSGAQLWRTNDGTTWKQAINPGFGDANNKEIEAVFVFQNQLYLGLKNTITGLEAWRSADGTIWEQANLDGFGESSNISTNGNNAIADFRSQLYMGTSNTLTGGEVWRMLPPAHDTVGVFRPSNGVIFLKNTNTTGFADVALNYGLGGDYPIVGDWDGNGTDTIGVYRNGRFLLRNTNTVGFAQINFLFGQPGDQPVAGDWNGDGIDTIGVYRATTGQFLLRDSNSAGPADASFYLGNVGDVGIAGDWNGDGIDTTGVFRPSNGVIFLKNTNTTGFADVALNYGLTGDKPVVGDWDNDSDTTIGVYRNARFYLRNSNTVGFADIILDLGIQGDMPIAGNWDGVP